MLFLTLRNMDCKNTLVTYYNFSFHIMPDLVSCLSLMVNTYIKIECKTALKVMHIIID